MTFMVVDAIDNVFGPFETREDAQAFIDETTAHERRNVNDWVIDPEIHELIEPAHLLAQYRALNGPLEPDAPSQGVE